MNEELTKLMIDSYDQGVKDALESIKEGLDALPKREWVGLTAEEIASIPLNEYTLQTAERLLKGKNA